MFGFPITHINLKPKYKTYPLIISQVVSYGAISFFNLRDNVCILKTGLMLEVFMFKDLFNYEGCFLSENDLFSIPPVKRSWISEYSIVKTVFFSISENV